MRIVFLIRALTSGGAERQVVELARALHSRAHAVTVVVYYAGDFDSELRAAGVPLICLEKKGRWDTAWFLWRLRRTLRELRADVIHGVLLTDNIFLALLKPALRPAKIVWGARASLMDTRPYDSVFRSLYRLEAMLSGRADLIIANSTAGGDSATARGFPVGRIAVVQNGIDTGRFAPDPAARAQLRAEWRIAGDEVLVGRIGRLDPMKDYPTFLASARLFAAGCPSARFVCVGGGRPEYQRRLLSLCREAGLDDRTIWAGKRTDMPAVYNALDVLCSSSAFGEGFSNTIAEAMACGVPCVVTDVGDSAAIVGPLGVVVKPGDPAALAEGMRMALALLTERNLSRDNGIRRRIETNFSVSRLADRTLAALAAVVHPPGTSASIPLAPDGHARE